MRATSVHSLKNWIRWVHEQLDSNYDVVVLVTGKPGVGKSHLANYLAHKVDSYFSAEKGTFFSGKTLIDASNRARKKSALVWDEIVEGGLSIETMTSENREVLKHLITGRSLNLLTLALAPKLKLFQGFTREDRATWWIHLPKRKTAVFHYVMDNNPYPGAKPYYPQQFILTGFPAMSPQEEATYEQLKSNWRNVWHRDSEKYLDAKQEENATDIMVRELKRKLHWLPKAVEAYAATFPGHAGKMRAWEEEILRQIEANRAAQSEEASNG